ncbi:P-loop containing nucleoside triphosphate hydrolase protein [Ceratobasidium sp. AG-I]|nr:P-loop containing nucleoside triphosphate hydrolase protein [Ceratobasidium sp. AG-I]
MADCPPSELLATRKTHQYSIRFSDEEIKSIEPQLCKKFGWNTVRPFQLNGIRALLQGRDTVIHVATSMGKTAVAAGPFALDSAAKLVVIYVIPLLALQDEMAVTFPKEFGVSAVAVNSQVTGSKPTLLQEVAEGKYQVILISPESLLSSRFINNVLSIPSFTQKVLSVVIDEAHCVSLHGAGFRKLYGWLAMLRNFLPQGVPFAALSATLTAHVQRDLCVRLEMHSNLLLINERNDRSNVTLVSRKCVHSLESYQDTRFVLPSVVKAALDIPKTFIYADDIDSGTGIVDYLNKCLPLELRDNGLIRPYNATFSTEYRREVMKCFREGIVRILVCTDAAGMGCNIPDIAVVVQWKVPESIEAFQQRAGRAARNKSLHGLAVLLAEPNAYLINPTEPAALSPDKNEDKKKRSKRKRQGRNTKKKIQQDPGAQPAEPAHPQITNNSPGGGIYAFVQTPLCRRAVLTTIFGNPPPGDLTVPCCDYCDPSVLARVAPPPREKQRRATKPKKIELNHQLQLALVAWREEVCRRDYAHAFWTPDAFLDDKTIESIAGRSDIGTESNLAAVLRPCWRFWDQYGPELLAETSTRTGRIPGPKGARRVLLTTTTTATANPKPSTITHLAISPEFSVMLQPVPVILQRI